MMELRQLKASDMFPMFGILSKIGFKEIKDSFSQESIQGIMNSFSADNGEDKTTYVGFSIIMDVVEVIMKNLPKCEHEIYNFLSGLSGMTVKEVSDMDMASFTEMIIAVVRKDEFKDFFRVVSGLFNQTR